MNQVQLFHTANRLIELLGHFGVSKAIIASQLGIGRTTIFNWKCTEKSPDGPTQSPTNSQVSKLGSLLVDRLRTQQSHLLCFLTSGDNCIGSRRSIAKEIRGLTQEALERLDELAGSWEEIDRELASLVVKYGPSVMDQISIPEVIVRRQLDPPQVSTGATLATHYKAEVEDLITVPAELHGKTYRYKYEAVYDVLMTASEDDTASDLAAQVRKLFPRGTFLPYRIGEDIGHILRADGVFAKYGQPLNQHQEAHLKRLLARLKKRGDLRR